MKDTNRSEIQFLKFFVYLMGFVLIFATLFLTYIIYVKNLNTSNIHLQSKINCSKFDLKVDGKVHNITFENNQLQVISKDQNIYKAYVYDYCYGNLINEVNISENIVNSSVQLNENSLNDSTSDNKNADHLTHEEIQLDDKNILS